MVYGLDTGAEMMPLDNFDITRIVDGVIKGLGEGLYQLPKDFKEKVSKNRILNIIQIPTDNPSDQIYLEIYVTNTGGMIWRIRDATGYQLYERAFT